jgi:3-isopropylmalate dehydrogenase
LIGVLSGEGVGPALVDAAVRLLGEVEKLEGHRFQIEYGGPIGLDALRQCGEVLSAEVIAFCSSVFARGGAILAGAGGGRFVYDLRRQFDLFCKLSPIRALPQVSRAGPLRPEVLRGIDILVVRENVSGVYQGCWESEASARNGRVECHSFSYSEFDVRRILRVAARIAGRRRGELAVVLKEGGIPGISALWRSCAVEIAAELGVACRFLDIDCAAYQLIRQPAEFDVVAAPNLFGDVLGDLGGVLCGSRGTTYSGNFAADGSAVFQTNHGSAHDLVGTNRANPAGQIFSMAFLLRERFGLFREARLMEDAVADVWTAGWRTPDLLELGCREVGTSCMAELVAAALCRRAAGTPQHGGDHAGDAPRSRAASQTTSTGRTSRLPAAVVAGKRLAPAALAPDDYAHRCPGSPSVVLWRVPSCDRDTTARATIAARDASVSWSMTKPAARAELLVRWAALLERNRDVWSLRLAEEIGKPVWQARGEIERTAAMLRAVAARAFPATARVRGTLGVAHRRPHGVAALVTPWNNPVYIPAGKIAPALLFGNVAVWKPAPAASAAALRLLDAFHEAGGPPGVLNLICGGRAAAELLMADPAVDAVSLTGSERAGNTAQLICGRRSIPLQAELGGNNAAIVWPETDVARAATHIAMGAFGMAGQRCTANRRAIVAPDLLEPFLAELAPAVAGLRWGDPLEADTQVGPLISVDEADRVAAVVKRACAAGHRVLVPHESHATSGAASEHKTFYPPTVVICEDDNAEIVQEETFGPVLVVQPARDWEHALRLNNGVRQGLAAALFCRESQRRRQFLREARAGILKLDLSTADAEIDLPFGGWKASGIGPAEHGDADAEFYSRIQTVYSDGECDPSDDAPDA